MMHHAKSDSEVTSLAASSPPRSPRRPLYYVMSPSHHDPAEKMSLVSSPPGSPLYQHHHPHHQRYASSPLHQSHHHSRESSATRFSASLVVKPLQGHHHLGAWRKLHRGTGLPGSGGEDGEGEEEDGVFVSSGVDPRCYVVWFCLGFVVLFSVFSLILWASSQAYPPKLLVKSIVFDNFDLQAGMDSTGVPTKMVTLNSTVHIAFRNPATFFGVHVSSTPLELYYYQLKLASGSVRQFYQPRKSTRKLLARMGGLRVPLYGGGPGITSRADGGASANFPLELRFTVRARAYVLGRLVKPTFHTAVRCSLRFREAGVGKPIDLVERCTYREH